MPYIISGTSDEVVNKMRKVSVNLCEASPFRPLYFLFSYYCAFVLDDVKQIWSKALRFFQFYTSSLDLRDLKIKEQVLFHKWWATFSGLCCLSYSFVISFQSRLSYALCFNLCSYAQKSWGRGLSGLLITIMSVPRDVLSLSSVITANSFFLDTLCVFCICDSPAYQIRSG